MTPNTAVKEFPKLQTVKQVKTFLGLANFYRRHVPRKAAISKLRTNRFNKERQ